MLFHWSGGGLTWRRGEFGGVARCDTMLCAVYGRSDDLSYSGAASGDVYVWRGVTLLRTIKAHDGPIFSLHALEKVSKLPLTVEIYYRHDGT